MKGWTSKPKDCLGCGLPLEVPRGLKKLFHSWKCKGHYYRSHSPHKERLIKEKAQYFQQLKAEVITHYGGKCVCCGEEHLVFLCIDHPNGGGNEHRRQTGIGSGNHFYAWLRKQKYPLGYRVLCHNCNFATIRFRICPHQEEVP